MIESIRLPDLGGGYAEVFRLIVTAIIIVAVYRIGTMVSVRWSHMTRLGKRLFVWYYITLLSIGYATLDSFRVGASLTSKDYVLAFAVTGLAIAALVKFSGDESTEPVYRVYMKGSIVQWRVQKLR